MYSRTSLAVTLLLLMLLSGCQATIAQFNEVAYQQATSLKVDALRVMDNASRSYSAHDKLVEDLNIKLEKAYEYAKGRPKNSIITEQWEVLLDPKRNLLGGFLVRWKAEDSLDQTFVTEAKALVAEGFNQIIGLESGLIKPKDKQ